MACRVLSPGRSTRAQPAALHDRQDGRPLMKGAKMSAITPLAFSFDSIQIRTIKIDGEPWFFAKDVCSAISLHDTNKALLSLDDDEKRKHEQYSGSGRKPMLINESGLYSLVIVSRKPEAKRFKRWITSQVLPSIRKTGRYAVQEPSRAIAEITIGASGVETIDTVIRRKLNTIEPGRRRSANARLLSQLRAAYGVHQVADIPAGRMQDALVFVGSYCLKCSAHCDDAMAEALEINLGSIAMAEDLSVALDMLKKVSSLIGAAVEETQEIIEESQQRAKYLLE